MTGHGTSPATPNLSCYTTTPVERVESLIVVVGQAGPAMSHMLSQRGCPHLVLERHRIVERWRTERWKGLLPIPQLVGSAAGFPVY